MDNREGNPQTQNSQANEVNEAELQQFLNKQSNRLRLFVDRFLVCPYEHEAHYLCNEGCSRSALICIEKGCRCQKGHQNCTIVSVQSFNKNIAENYQKNQLKQKEKLTEQLTSVIDKMISDLSDWNQKIQKRFKMFGLTREEQEYVKIWNSSKQSLKSLQINKLITGKFIRNIQKDKTSQRRAEIRDASANFYAQVQSLKNMMMDGIQSLKSKQQKIKSSLFPKIFVKSDIIESLADQEILLKMFPTIQKASFLFIYNKYDSNSSLGNFSNSVEISKTYSNVLILVKNQFDKTVGAFTRCKFKNFKGENAQKQKLPPSVEQSLFQQFILSFNNKIKANIKHKNPFVGNQTCFTRIRQTGEIKFNLISETVPKNFIIGDSKQITFKGDEYAQVFQGLTSFELLGVDEELDEKSHAEIIEIYNLTFSKSAVDQKLKSLQNQEPKWKIAVNGSIFEKQGL